MKKTAHPNPRFPIPVPAKEIFSKQNTCKGRFSIKTVAQLQKTEQNLPLQSAKFFLETS